MTTPAPLVLASLLVLLVLIPVVVALPSAADHGADGPLVTDPIGDAGPMATGTPTGFEAYDITAIDMEGIDADTLRVIISVVALSGAPPHGEIGAVFAVDGRHFMAGFTVLVFGGSYYADGFACPATPDGEVNGTVGDDCIGIAGASAMDDRYTVDVPRSFLGAERAGAVISEPFGWSEIVQTKSEPTFLDHTEKGHSMTLTTGTPPAGETSEQVPAAGDAAGTPDEPPAETPHVGPFAMVVGLAIGALVRARRRT